MCGQQKNTHLKEIGKCQWIKEPKFSEINAPIAVSISRYWKKKVEIHISDFFSNKVDINMMIWEFMAKIIPVKNDKIFLLVYKISSTIE